MSDNGKKYEMLVDYITGKTVPNIGVEEIRQRVEQYLVEVKGYRKEDIYNKMRQMCFGSVVSNVVVVEKGVLE